jgi:hypothetical protein
MKTQHKGFQIYATLKERKKERKKEKTFEIYAIFSLARMKAVRRSWRNTAG